MVDLREDQQNEKIVRRGFDEEDKRWFSMDEVINLQKAQQEVQWLLNRGYKIGPIIEFIGGHYQFSVRQRTALMRATSSTVQCEKRKVKLLSNENAKEGYLYIDGFNLIITLEVALSGGVLILGNDEVFRDLAGLRGTYRLIDKTNKALEYLVKTLKQLKVQKIKFFLDSPVSNSGRLKVKILEYFNETGIDIDVELVPNPDVILSKLENVVTGDSVIIDECRSWYNLSRKIVEDNIKEAWVVSLNYNYGG